MRGAATPCVDREERKLNILGNKGPIDVHLGGGELGPGPLDNSRKVGQKPIGGEGGGGLDQLAVTQRRGGRLL